MPSSAGLGLVFWEFRALNSIHGCPCFCRRLGSLWVLWQVLPSCIRPTPRSGLTSPCGLPFDFHSLNINPKNFKATFHCQTPSLTQCIFLICSCTSPPFKLPYMDHSAQGGKSTWFAISLSRLLCWPSPNGPRRGGSLLSCLPSVTFLAVFEVLSLIVLSCTVLSSIQFLMLSSGL